MKKLDNIKNEINKEEEIFDGFDDQVKDFAERLRAERTSSGIQNNFYVPEDKKEKNYIYQWSSTDKDSPSNPALMEKNGWRKVEGWEVIPTGGYTIDGQPGKHYLMKIKKEFHNILLENQEFYANKQKDSIFATSKTEDLQMNVKIDN
jgi:hypothetical protein